MSTAVSVIRSSFGALPDGSEVGAYTIANDFVEMRLITFGARVVTLKTRDRYHAFDDIALGYQTIEEYLYNKNTYFGVIAGRYANRIGQGRLVLDGVLHQTALNNLGVNTLHGGPEGFDRRNWSAREIANGVEFSLISPDGDQGFPGELLTTVAYTLRDNTVSMGYRAETSKTTVINLTNHTYFNLAGEGNGSIVDHYLQIDAEHVTSVDQWLIPTGKLKPVNGTPFDFTVMRRIGDGLDQDPQQLEPCHGFDHNWALSGKGGELKRVAILSHPPSGRVLTIESTEPGLQFNAGQYFDGVLVGKRGNPYGKHSALALETQHYPDSPNHDNFPSTQLRPGQQFQSLTTWTFTTQP